MGEAVMEWCGGVGCGPVRNGKVGQGGRGVSGSGVVGRVQVRRVGLGVERSGKSWLGRAVTGYKGESDEIY
jgi:hypothetical protein